MTDDLPPGNGSTDLLNSESAYRERIRELDESVSALTAAAAEREQQAAAEIAAYQAAYAERVGYLERQVAALTQAAIDRETHLQRQRETDYQLLMIQQNLLAEFKDLEPEFHGLYERCKPFTMTSLERLYSLYQGVEYVCASEIEGDFAECGVWQGGSCMLMALALMRHRSTSRRIWMFDTFVGHPQPDAERDVDLWGNRAIDEWRRNQAAGTGNEWGLASLAEVQANLASTGYPENRLHFIKGLVENTVPDNIPEALALLRLDSDWYESTRVALLHFYPRLVSGGVLIIDDYGHYKGQRQAVDEYFRDLAKRPLLHRIDYSCRVMIKP
jgi:O-methyltransferase